MVNDECKRGADWCMYRGEPNENNVRFVCHIHLAFMAATLDGSGPIKLESPHGEAPCEFSGVKVDRETLETMATIDEAIERLLAAVKAERRKGPQGLI